ncbi:hypothetical protein LGN19_28575 [Burkholderia sp. AU30198]|uniref:hypothetical protein n=1 Tax=Burkholderia sp. AU30198 TaxID=2879627 RepID=UPI001CF49CD4|nr:hypothetical protein [Burkholderia sp. AU30198]MCA8297753.1 hypothetical protein [Burkholderia sp. AU30198]
MKRQQMADCALRLSEMEIDRPLVPDGQTGRRIPECFCNRHRYDLVIYVPDSY